MKLLVGGAGLPDSPILSLTHEALAHETRIVIQGGRFIDLSHVGKLASSQALPVYEKLLGNIEKLGL